MAKTPHDTIIQATQSMLESAKDAATTNIVSACRSGQLKIESAEVQKLLLVVGASIEEGFNRPSRAFSRAVVTALANATPASLDAPTPPSVPASTKKK